jgi:hypothetical protein
MLTGKANIVIGLAVHACRTNITRLSPSRKIMTPLGPDPAKARSLIDEKKGKKEDLS